MPTLDLKNLINVIINLSPAAAIRNGFNLGLIVGKSPMINSATRVKVYSSLSDMLTDGWSGFEPEYMAAQIYFSQNPQPGKVAIGRWDVGETAVQAITACRLANTEWYACCMCGLTKAEILLVAAFIEAATPKSAFFYTTGDSDVPLGTAGNILLSMQALKYNRSIGQYTANTNSTVGAEIGATGGSTNIAAGSATTFKVAFDGDVTPKSVTLSLPGLNTGVLIAAAMQAAIRALGGIYVNGIVKFVDNRYVIYSGTSGALSTVTVTAGTSNDVAATLKIGAANGAIAVPGAVQPMAVIAIMGYAMGANTGLSDSAYTLAYKLEAGITPDALTEAQVTTIKSANGNVYVNRGSYYNVFEQGVVASGIPFDEIINLDMLSNNIQQAITELLTSTAKIPQTEEGMTMLLNSINRPLQDAVDTGFIAPGIWTGPTVLKLKTGNALSQGYILQSDPISTQSIADRANRIAPAIYACIKLAGAIEHVVCTVNVNI